MTGAHPNPLSADQRAFLDGLAWRAIEDGLERGAWLPSLAADRALRVNLADCEGWARTPAATFVTLELGGALRGCIGTLQAWQPLAQDVADQAFAAAFRDPRFTALRPAELPGLTMHLSVLNPPQPVQAPTEQALIEQLEPGAHGVVLRHGAHRGTFLPSVWESLPEPRAFLRALKRKAGLPLDGWPPGIEVSLYRVQEWHAGARQRA